MQEKNNKPLNGLSKALLRHAVANPGTAIRDLIRPFLGEHSENTLRRRLKLLEEHNLIKRDTRYTRKVLIVPTDEGKELVRIVGDKAHQNLRSRRP